ncbi:MAG: hypothetical protein F6K10_33660, partial [Moorea sp. SIO2B7]|nr:hypothetical protein [Moorena sp. SIO2B7]
MSLITNGLLMLTLVHIWLREPTLPGQSLTKSSSIAPIQLIRQIPTSTPELGEQHHLTYQEWVALLRREAEVAAENKPANLNILLGDSISLWFSPQLLPPGKNWLNQAISGETSRGLLKRLELFDETQPKVIFVMIGINDLLRGFKDDTIVVNHLLIIRYLRRLHPQTRIVIQSILPHSGAKATWEGRDRLLKIPNQRIQKINRR